MMKENAMTNARDKLIQCAKPLVLARHLNDANSLYVLVVSLLATLVSLPLVWYFSAAAYASSGLVA
jgi:hypothetical protein